jgi:hypothetical protein
MRLVLMKWKHTLKVAKRQTHRVSFMTHDYINRFDISINTTKAEPTKISHILISHNFHRHDWSILFKVIMEGPDSSGIPPSFPKMRETTCPQQFVSIICKPLEYGRFFIESMWSHNKAWNHGMWNLTMTMEDHQVHHGAAVLQIGTPSCTTWFLMAPSIIL